MRDATNAACSRSGTARAYRRRVLTAHGRSSLVPPVTPSTVPPTVDPTSSTVRPTSTVVWGTTTGGVGSPVDCGTLTAGVRTTGSLTSGLGTWVAGTDGAEGTLGVS